MKTIPVLPEGTAFTPSARPSARWALAGLASSMLLASLGTSSANVGLPALAQAFGVGFGAVQWIVLAYLLAVTSLVVGVGKLGDVLGCRRLLLGGIALFTFASMLCGLVSSFGLLLAARALQGIGAAAMMALTMGMVGDAVPKENTGGAMGLLGTMSAVGTALGPALGGLLLAGFGWQSLFLANVPLGILALALVWRHLPADAPRAGRAGLDSWGTLLLAATVAAYALAMTTGRGGFGALHAGLLAAAALGAAAFVFVETRVAAPLIRPAMLRDPALGAALATNLLVSSVMMATLVVGPFHLTHALGLDPAQVGLAVAVGPAVAALMGVPAGRIVDRFGPHRAIGFGLAGVASGCGLLSVLPVSPGVAGYIAPLALVTASYALFQTANNSAVMAGVAQERRGVVSGMLNLARNLGLVTGASLMGAVFAFGSGAGDMTGAPAAAVAAGTRFTFAVATLLAVAALVIARAARQRVRLLA